MLLITFIYQYRYGFSHLICQHGMPVLVLSALSSIHHLSSALPCPIISTGSILQAVILKLANILLPSGFCQQVDQQEIRIQENGTASVFPSSSASVGFPSVAPCFPWLQPLQVDPPWLQILLNPNPRLQ